MATLEQFGKRMLVISKKVDENADELVRKVAMAVDTTVVMATPVDTGRARSNWRVSIGSLPDHSTHEAYQEGKGQSTAQANAQAQMKYAEGKIKGYRGGVNNPYIFISNNLPYIKRLNNGWSAQAPSAFVEKAVLNGVKMITRHSILPD